MNPDSLIGAGLSALAVGAVLLGGRALRRYLEERAIRRCVEDLVRGAPVEVQDFSCSLRRTMTERTCAGCGAVLHVGAACYRHWRQRDSDYFCRACHVCRFPECGTHGAHLVPNGGGR